MLHIQIIMGSTRPNRKNQQVTDWLVEAIESTHGLELEFELIDLAKVGLPLLDEPIPPIANNYQNAHTKEWAKTIGKADGYILVTPEYNHGYSAVLKNALDFLYAEWRRKPVAFVSYGVMNGVRAVEQLKTVTVQLDMAPINAQVGFSVMHDWKDGTLQAREHHVQQLQAMLGELTWWAKTLKEGRKVIA